MNLLPVTMPRLAGVLATLLTLSVLGAAAQAFTFNTVSIKCTQSYCGKISHTPKTSLLNVDPDPLPRVDPNDSQTVTVEWSVRFGLRANHEFCATQNLAAAPGSKDPCIPLPGATVINNGSYGTTFEDTLTLSSAFYRPQAKFYVRTTSLIHFSGQPASIVSNALPFEWPLNLANLYAHNPKPRVAGGVVEIEHEVSNTSTSIVARASRTQYVVSFCEGTSILPLSDPENPESDRICRPGVEGFDSTHNVFQMVGQINPQARATNFTNISGIIPSLVGGMWISITAIVDIDGSVDESNELDNQRLETRFIMP